MLFNSVLYYTGSFLLFFLLTWYIQRNKNHQLFRHHQPASEPYQWVIWQFAGIVLFGRVLFIRTTYSPSKIIFGDQQPPTVSLIVITCCLLLILYISKQELRKRFQDAKIPNKNATIIQPVFLCTYFLLRPAYLVIYELWFRGYLLLDTAIWLGPAAAVALNVFLYVLIHIFSGKKEITGSVLLGIVMCLITLWINAAWPALLLHLILGLVVEGSMLLHLYQKQKMKMESTMSLK